MKGHRREPDQGQRIQIAPGEPGILNVVSTHGHQHAGPLQRHHRRQGPQQGGALGTPAEQPQIGAGQGHHREPRHGHSLRLPGQAGAPQHAQAAGMAAGDRQRQPPLQHRGAHQGQAPARVGVALIDVQVNAQAQALRQLQQAAKGLRVAGRLTKRRAQYAPQQTAGGRHPPRQGLARRRTPVAQGRQGHQLQLQPLAPALAQLQQRLPAGLASGAGAVDVAADRPQAMAPGPLQGPLPPLQNLFGAALGKLPLVGLHGGGHGALPIGEGRSGKGLVEVGVGLHRRGDRQGQARPWLSPPYSL